MLQVESVGAFAFSWAVGFVIVLAPAGAGFRDVLLAALLAPAMGAGPATAISLVSRIATSLADVITASAAVLSYRRSNARRDAQALKGATRPKEEERTAAE